MTPYEVTQLTDRSRLILTNRMRRIIVATEGRPWTRREMDRALAIVATAKGGTGEADLKAFVNVMSRFFYTCWRSDREVTI